MPGKVAKIGTFSDWVGSSTMAQGNWRQPRRDCQFQVRHAVRRHRDRRDSVRFLQGPRKWENLRQVPTQQMRDALINMIVYQGDTEFASVEQQRNLFESAPTDWDRAPSPA